MLFTLNWPSIHFKTCFLEKLANQSLPTAVRSEMAVLMWNFSRLCLPFWPGILIFYEGWNSEAWIGGFVCVLSALPCCTIQTILLSKYPQLCSFFCVGVAGIAVYINSPLREMWQSIQGWWHWNYSKSTITLPIGNGEKQAYTPLKALLQGKTLYHSCQKFFKAERKYVPFYCCSRKTFSLCRVKHKTVTLYVPLTIEMPFLTQFAAKLAAAAAAEEGGEENVVAPMMSFEWRIQVPGQTIPGETADDQLPFIKELAAFEGVFSIVCAHCGLCCRRTLVLVQK